MDTDAAPSGIPPMLYTRHVCAALDLKPSQVKYWFDAGHLPSRRLRHAGQRFTSPADLIVFAVELGLELNWEAVLEMD